MTIDVLLYAVVVKEEYILDHAYIYENCCVVLLLFFGNEQNEQNVVLCVNFCCFLSETEGASF